MVGMVIPIQIEAGRSPPAKCPQQLRTAGDVAVRKPLRKKNSRQKCRTFNIEIELEGFTGKDSAERKNGVACQGEKMSVVLPRQKIPRRTSNKDLRGVIRRTSSKDLRSGVMMRRQSSRDVLGGYCKKVAHPDQTQHKDPKLSRMISDPSIEDVCLPSLDERFTIRRDSINGLRIISKLDQSQTEALDRLADIALGSAQEREEEEEEEKFSKFQRDALKTHNKFRARHGVEALALDTELCTRAQQYADTLASTDTFEHSGDPELGENLYWSWSSDPAWRCGGEEPVSSWYDECRGYRYEREPRDTETGHFTQLVWDTSRHLGVGVSQSLVTGRFYVVMKYDPPGNVIGSYTRHVHQPKH